MIYEEILHRMEESDIEVLDVRHGSHFYTVVDDDMFNECYTLRLINGLLLTVFEKHTTSSFNKHFWCVIRVELPNENDEILHWPYVPSYLFDGWSNRIKMNESRMTSLIYLEDGLMKLKSMMT